jgi:hypothetical protein
MAPNKFKDRQCILLKRKINLEEKDSPEFVAPLAVSNEHSFYSTFVFHEHAFSQDPSSVSQPATEHKC